MFKYRMLLLALVVSLFSITCWAEDTPEGTGVLIGLRNDIGHNIGDVYSYSTYRTLWITLESSQVKIREGTGIITPYQDHFWQIDGLCKTKIGVGESSPTFRIQYLWAHPLGQPLPPESLVTKKYIQSSTDGWKDVDETVKLDYVGNKYVCANEYNYYWSGGTMRMWNMDINVKEIKNINPTYINSQPSTSTKMEKRISLNQIFGDNATPYIKKYRLMKVSDNKDKDEDNENVTDKYGWGLTRKEGRWIPQIAEQESYSTMSVAYTTYDLYDLPLAIPQSLMPYNNTMCNYKVIKKTIPGIKDAIVSPNRDLTVILTSGKLLVYSGNKLENPVRVKLRGKESLIMAEWAFGANVPQWTAQLGKYLEERN